MQNWISTLPLINIVNKWKKHLIIFIVIATIASIIASSFLQKKYLSKVTLVPTNPKLTDRNFVYGNNIADLNSIYGSEEDADRLITNLKLNSNYALLVDSFKLIENYKIKNSETSKQKAIKQLIENCLITKTENGALEISIWDTDKNLAAKLANALVEITLAKNIYNNNQVNESYLQGLKKQFEYKSLQIKNLDTIQNPILRESQKKVLISSLEKDAAAISELSTSTASNIPSAIILEKAIASNKADKPNLFNWVLGSFFSSIVFGLFLIILLEKWRK